MPKNGPLKERTLKKKYSLYYPLLEGFVKSSQDKRQHAIQKMNNTSISVIRECCYNVLYNPALFSDNQREDIRKKMSEDWCYVCYLTNAQMPPTMRKKFCHEMCDNIAVLLELLLPKIKTHVHW